MRFINVSNLHTTATLGSADGAINVANVAFWNNSDFVYYPHGQYDVELRDSNGSVVMTLSLWLSGNTAYSFYVAGNTLGYFIN